MRDKKEKNTGIGIEMYQSSYQDAFMYQIEVQVNEKIYPRIAVVAFRPGDGSLPKIRSHVATSTGPTPR